METRVAKLVGVAVAMLAIMAVLAGCSQGVTRASGGTPSDSPSNTASIPATTGPSSRSTVAYHPKTVTPQITGTTVSISAEEVGRNGIENFSVTSPAGNMPFMAYQLDGKYYVRAAICVPCGSKSFTLKSGTLICDSCRTVFDATTGTGTIGVGACITYAKKAAAYTIDGGNIAINIGDLTTAYQNTLNRI